jgi:metal-responsive CopG/Arc/MetJ family transcriptional regulator
MPPRPQTRTTITLADDVREQIREFQEQEGMVTEAEAIRSLIVSALREWRRKRARDRDSS